MRYISKIILHCSDSDYPHHDNVETIRKWHKDKGWSDIGYHYLVTEAHGLQTGRPLHLVGAHCFGHNQTSIGVCLTGKNNFSEMQFNCAARVILDLLAQFGLTPDDVYPHNHFNSEKTCPNYSINEIKERIYERYEREGQKYIQRSDDALTGKRHRLRKGIQGKTVPSSTGREANIDG